ncbi:hypothetical protein EVAR_84465_1 [Eumeta japonica]|uniref:non-specific serine/threonine protein kinase n=1 Tax=Eumeta variegata TaxID=151549 RepID=A0A4C1XCT2_EUMVA|nr:hypothetical protein EVAR_84465_1 [Eumeta japonica]
MTKIAIGIWSVNLRERFLGAETVSGLGVQTVRSPEYITGTDARSLTAAARYTVARHHTHSYTRGARHYGTRLEGTLPRSNILKRVVQGTGPKATDRRNNRNCVNICCLASDAVFSSSELLGSSHPNAVAALKTHIGNLWLESAKHARKAGNIQQANMYILNAEQYRPVQLFIEKAKIYWARGLQDQAFTTLKRALDDSYPDTNTMTNDEKKICAKAKLLNAKYNDVTTRLDVDDNIACYKEAVNAFPAWEKSLKASGGDGAPVIWSRRINALNSYGKALLYGHKYLYQSMPRMLSIWLDMEVDKADMNSKLVQAQMTDIIRSFSERLPVYLYLPAFSQIVSRICHPINEVYAQLKDILVKLIMAYPHHALWMMMCVIKSSYPQRVNRCNAVLDDHRLKIPNLVKLKNDFTQLAEKLIELCNKSVPNNVSMSMSGGQKRMQSYKKKKCIAIFFLARTTLSPYVRQTCLPITTVSSLVRALPRLLASENFSHIMMPFQEFCKIVLPSKAARQERMDFDISSEPSVYIAGIEEEVQILLSLQKPRKVTLKGSDGKKYFIMLKPRDDLRKDFRLMEFNGVVNRFLQDAPETRRRRLYIRTYNVLPLNEECGLIEWVPKLIGLRPILTHIYKQKGMHTSNRTLKELMCSCKDPLVKKLRIFEEELLPRHPPVFQEWFKNVFTDPHGWSRVGYAFYTLIQPRLRVHRITGLGDRHGENILYDQTNGDTVHVDFNCLFNKGEYFEWAERVPFRLTHNMEAAMGPLKREGMFRKNCEAVMRVLRSQTAALMSVVGPFVYDPLVGWGRQAGRPAPIDCGERTNEKALENIKHIRQRLNGMVRTKNKHLSLSLSPEGQVKELIEEATSVHNLCQMYMGWGPYL